MEDQGRRLLLAVAIAFGIMFLWQFLFPPPEPEKKPDQPAENEQPKDGADKQPTPTPDLQPPGTTVGLVGDGDKQPAQPPGTTVGLVGDKQPTATDPAAQRQALLDKDREACLAMDAAKPLVYDFPLFRAEFSHCGGTLASWQLKGSRFREERDGTSQAMDLMRTGQLVDKRSFAVRFRDGESNQFVEWNAHAPWTLVEEQAKEDSLTFSWSYKVPDKNGAMIEAFELTKTYKLYPDDYLVEVSLQVVNKASTNERQAVVFSLYGFQDPDEDTDGGWTSVDRAWRSTCYLEGEESRRTASSLAKRPKERTPGDLTWGGFTHSYFLFVASPHNDTNADFGCNSYGFNVDDKVGGMRTDIQFPVTTISTDEGRDIVQTMYAYIGPKYLDKLESISGVIDYDPGFGTSIDFPWYAFLARPLLWLLQWFYAFLGNWGLAIIFLTLMVKLATLYWTTKSMRSMRAMAKLSPQIKALQEKYKNDKPRLQQETMALYRTHNVNPLSGCLPILLQMPIWISLYRMLMYAGELYHAPFIPGWIDDLTAEDPFYILPVGLVVVMFVQAKLTPTASTSANQKIMQYGMPLMFGVFAFFFPAGLTLYIFTNTLLSSAHHLWMRRTEKVDEAAKAQNARNRKGSGTSGRKGGAKDASKGGQGSRSKASSRKKSSSQDTSQSAERDSTSDDETSSDSASSDDNQQRPAQTSQRPRKKKSRSKRSGGKRGKRK